MHTKWQHLFLVVFFSLSFIVRAKSVTPIILQDGFKQFGVRNANLEIYEDRQNQWKLSQVSSEAWTDSFKIVLGELPTNKNTGSTYWMRFTLLNLSTSNRQWILEFFDHNINEAILYTPAGPGSFVAEVTGNSYPFKLRKWLHKNLEYTVDIPPDSALTYYIKIKSANQNVIVPELRAYNNFIAYALGEYFLLGIFYGMLAIMSLYNLWLYLALRQSTYLFYVCYVLSIAVYTMCQNGMAFQFLWPGHPAFNKYGADIAVFSIMLFSLLFTKKFLQFDKHLPYFNKIIAKLLWIRAGILLTGLLFFPAMAKWQFLDLLMFSITYSVSLFSFFKGFKTSGYFIFAYSLVFLTFVVSILEHYGFLWSDIFTVYSINIGIVFDIVFLSISLADQLRREIVMREEVQIRLIGEMKEKEQLSDKVNRELEEKVNQRTMELNSANLKLQKQAEAITSMNLKLDLTNSDLKKSVAEISQKRLVKPRVAYAEFLKVYTDTPACFRFIEELKSAKGFQCKKCKGRSFGKGKEVFDRRCTKCGYNESITANTLFHKLKFPIVKAFYLTHLIFTRKEITAEELSEMVDLRKETCSVFKRKIVERMSSCNQKELHSWDMLILNEISEATEVLPAT